MNLNRDSRKVREGQEEFFGGRHLLNGQRIDADVTGGRIDSTAFAL
jgi:hypothetical protein